MRIAYFTDSLPPLVDGVTLTVSKLVETLQQEQVTFRMFSAVQPDASLAWRDQVRRVFSVPLVPYRYYRLALPYFQRLARELDTFRPDLVHLISPSLLGLHGLNYAVKRGIPVVSSYHTHFVSYFPHYRLHRFNQLGWKYLRWFHNRCTMTYAPSVSMQQALFERGIRNVELWKRGVELSRFAPQHRDDALRRELSPDGKPILLYAGRLVQEKDLRDLVEACHYLNMWGCEYKMVFAGEGPFLYDLMTDLPNAHFCGQQERAHLARYYASADIFVFPSTTETFGNVVLEALASGLPVVGTRRGGVGDLITHGYDGLLATPNSPRDFAGQIQLLLEDRNYTHILGTNARKTAAAFSWQVENKKLLESYRKILSTQAPGSPIPLRRQQSVLRDDAQPAALQLHAY